MDPEFNKPGDEQRVIAKLIKGGYSTAHPMHQQLVLLGLATIANRRRNANDPNLEVTDPMISFTTDDIARAKLVAGSAGGAYKDPPPPFFDAPPGIDQNGLLLAGPVTGGTGPSTQFGPDQFIAAADGNGDGGFTGTITQPGANDTDFLATVNTENLTAGSLINGAPSGQQYQWTGTEFIMPQNPFVDETFLWGKPTFGEATRGLGIPNFQGLGGAFVQRQYEPALTAFLGQQASTTPSVPVHPETGMPLDFQANPFSDFITQNLGGSRINRSALQSFGNLLGASAAGTTPQSLGLGSSFANPANELQAQRAANLGLGALRGSIGSLAANLLAPNASQLFNQFAMSGQAANQNAFLPFLNERLGIGF